MQLYVSYNYHDEKERKILHIFFFKSFMFCIILNYFTKVVLYLPAPSCD